MERAENLLAEGRYQEAFRELVRHAEAPMPPHAALATLRLAEFYALYGESERENLEAALARALELDPELAEDPLFRALAELAAAYRGEEPELFETDDPRAAYHLAQAALYVGWPREALALLEGARGLPEFLAWRASDLKAKALEDLGQSREAFEAYQEAFFKATQGDRPFVALDAAAAALDAGMPEAAKEMLAAGGLPPEPDAEASWHYLTARAELALGNPRRALDALAEAERREAELAEPSYGVALLKGQALMELGRYREAREAFARALELAPPEERDYARHELAVALLEEGRRDEAERHLKALFAEPAYPHRGAVAADLAELYYRLADLEATEAWAEEAIRLGQAASGELFLGHVAYDRMQLEEALGHYRRVAELAPEGSREWLIAQQTAVEILAQLGYPDPEEVLRRARAALSHTPPSDDWASALRLYAERAEELLSGGRTLN